MCRCALYVYYVVMFSLCLWCYCVWMCGILGSVVVLFPILLLCFCFRLLCGMFVVRHIASFYLVFVDGCRLGLNFSVYSRSILMVLFALLLYGCGVIVYSFLVFYGMLLSVCFAWSFVCSVDYVASRIRF